jgi:glucose-1-phosphate cytidylyltransferase
VKCVILAGGLGTRLYEETATRPKPMVEIGGKPILWHIMKYYLAQGCTDFIICLGYKGYMIKEYFYNYFLHMSDVTIDFSMKSTKIHRNEAEPWCVTLVDTGDSTMTGGRLKRVYEYVKNESAFFFTYGDGLADVDLDSLLRLHQKEGKLATVTAVRPPGRFGVLKTTGCSVTGFEEKPEDGNVWINGGFFALSPKAINYIDGDQTSWEQEPMQGLASDGQLSAHFHYGFWQPMDTEREKRQLEEKWRSGNAPWKVW